MPGYTIVKKEAKRGGGGGEGGSTYRYSFQTQPHGWRNILGNKTQAEIVGWQIGNHTHPY